MVAGLVYTEVRVDANGDPRAEDLGVRRSLARGARSVSRMRIRDSPNQRTVYANGPGRSLLRSVLALHKKTEEQEEALRAETEARRAETEACKEATEGLEKKKIQTLTQELMILGPLRGTAINIRDSVPNGAVRPSWSWTAVDGVQRSRPVFFKSCPAPHGQRPFPPPSPAVRQGIQ